jgi:hypothetical protein
MANELEKSGPNVFEQYGRAATQQRMLGIMLRFQKGDYLHGKHGEVLSEGTRMAVVMDSLTVGWQKWLDSKPVEARMGLVAEGYIPETRREIGDQDENYWERDDNGNSKDPWQLTNQVVMIDEDAHQLYTFVTSTKGGISAIGQLSKEYGREMRMRPSELPVVELGVDSYVHPNRSLGRIKVPTFYIIGWTARQPLLDIVTLESRGSAASAAIENKAAAAEVIPPAAPAAAQTTGTTSAASGGIPPFLDRRTSAKRKDNLSY